MSKRSPVTPFDFSDEVVVDDHSPHHDVIDNNSTDEFQEENNPVTAEQEEQEGGERSDNEISINSSGNNNDVIDNNNADELEENNNLAAVEQEEDEGSDNSNSIHSCGNNNNANSSSSASTERINSNGRRPFIEEDHNDDDDDSYERNKKIMKTHAFQVTNKTEDYNAQTGEHLLNINKNMGKQSDEILEISTSHEDDYEEEITSNSSKETRTGSDDDIDGNEVRNNGGLDEAENQQVEKKHQDHESH